MPNYYRSIVTCIDYNDYIKLEEILNKPDLKDCFIPDLLLSKTIKKQNKRCFDLIYNYIVNNLDEEDTFEKSYIYAFKLYNKAKNEENEYYVIKLIDKLLYLEPYAYYVKYLYNYDINIFKKYINYAINNNNYDKDKVMNLLLNDKIFDELYFMEIFNRIFNKEKQKEFIIEFYYDTIKLFHKNIISFNYFINNKDFDYNKLMLTDKEKFIDCNMVNKIIYSNKLYSITCIKYLSNNPIDYKDFDTFTILEMAKLNMFHFQEFRLYRKIYNKYIRNTKTLLKLIKKPIIINCPKIKLLNSICNYYLNIPNFDNKYNYEFIVYYLYHKCGYNFDIYGDLNIDTIKNRGGALLNDKQKRYIVEIIRFGKYIGQDIPEHLRNYIYELCDNNELLDIEISNEEIQNMLKPIKR